MRAPWSAARIAALLLIFNLLGKKNFYPLQGGDSRRTPGSSQARSMLNVECRTPGLAGPLNLPAGFGDAGDHAQAGKLAETETRHFEFAEITLWATCQLASIF